MTPSDSAGSKIWCKQREIIFTGPNYSQFCSSYGLFCPKFSCHGNGGRSGVNINDTVKLADLENHTLKAKIVALSYT